MIVRIIENIPLHQGSSGFDGHQNCSNSACGSCSPVATERITLKR